MVSPTGVLRADDHEFRFVDGGFSDNTGAGTAVELLGMVLADAKELGLADRVRPVLLVVHTANSSLPATHRPWDQGLSGLLNDPLTTLDAVRNRNANDYRRWLDASAKAAGVNVHVVEWTLPTDPSNPYPLGWLLAQSTQERIAKQVSASMIGAGARRLEQLTGWSVRPCNDEKPGARSLCEEARARGED